AARKNIFLRKQVDGSLNVWADQNQLHVVLRNLIHNAIKFSPVNESVEIRATADGHYCHVTVKDSGVGMTEEEIEAITGPGHPFSKSGTEQEKGTGLGMLLCKEFIARNDGQMG